MRTIFYGFIFIYLNFQLNLGDSSIGLIPSFIGYWLMLKGLTDLSAESEHFVRLQPIAFGMGIFTLVLYILDLLGIATDTVFPGLVLGLISIVMSIFITYNLVQGVREMEQGYGADLNGEQLQSRWIYLAVTLLAANLLFWMPFVNIAAVLAALVFIILFLAAFYRSMTFYEAIPAEVPQP